jgi:protein CpxP
MKKLLMTTMACACLTALTATTTIAQTAPAANAPSAARPAMRGEHRHDMRGQYRPAMSRADRVEARLAYVKTALKITPAQQAQWDAYANFSRKSAQERDKQFQSRQARGPGVGGHRGRFGGNAIERLERQQAFLAQAQTRVAQRLEVEKPLYAALSPDQQKIADEVLSSRQHRQFGGGRGGHRRG